MALVLDWKKKLGYRKDPFEQKILRPAHRYVVGFSEERERFNLFLIKDEKLATLTGDHGEGKTMFLAWALDELKSGRYRANYIDAKKANKQAKMIDILLSGNTNLLMRGFQKNKTAEEKYRMLIKKLSKKPHVLLADNAGSLTKEGITLLEDIMDKTNTHVLLADQKDKLSGLKLSKVALKLETPSYDVQDLSLLLLKRIESVGGYQTFPFDASELKKMSKKAGNNPSKLLSVARERAIELSLKVKEPPQHDDQKTVEDGTETKRMGFLNIKIDKGGSQVKKAAPKPEPEEISEDSAVDADMLKEMVGEVDSKKPEK